MHGLMCGRVCCRLEEAEQRCKAALAVVRELELVDGPALADVLLVLGRTQAAQQQLSEAEDSLRHCLRIRCAQCL